MTSARHSHEHCGNRVHAPNPNAHSCDHNMRGSFCALALVVNLSGALSGCAVYNTYEKCGLYGCRDDANITADINAQFRKRLDLEPNAIKVQTLDHVVYLYGLVSSSLEINTAESIAAKVPGVTEVVSSIGAQTR